MRRSFGDQAQQLGSKPAGHWLRGRGMIKTGKPVVTSYNVLNLSPLSSNDNQRATLASQILNDLGDALLGRADLDIVHVNVYFPRIDDTVGSDHEPLVARFNLDDDD
jgi:hypothetical protein